MKKLILGIVITVSAVAPLFGVILPDGTDAPVSDVRKDSQGRILRATLSEPAYIQTPAGKLKLKGWVSFYESGKFKEGLLSEAREIYGRQFTEGTKIRWDEEGAFLGEVSDGC